MNRSRNNAPTNRNCHSRRIRLPPIPAHHLSAWCSRTVRQTSNRSFYLSESPPLSTVKRTIYISRYLFPHSKKPQSFPPRLIPNDSSAPSWHSNPYSRHGFPCKFLSCWQAPRNRSGNPPVKHTLYSGYPVDSRSNHQKRTKT